MKQVNETFQIAIIFSLVLVGAYQWLVCNLLKDSAAKLQKELLNGMVRPSITQD